MKKLLPLLLSLLVVGWGSVSGLPTFSPAVVLAATQDIEHLELEEVDSKQQEPETYSKSPCTEISNHVFLIDRKLVFHVYKGYCFDNSFGYTLTGKTKTGESLKCSFGETIGGIQEYCTDEGLQGIFQVIMGNLEKDNLGLGSGHKIERVLSKGELDEPPVRRQKYPSP